MLPSRSVRSLDLAQLSATFPSRIAGSTTLFKLLLGATVSLVVFATQAAVANAHPHVFIDAKAEIVFGAAGEITAVRNIWQFDEAFTAYAIQGLDTNNDGTYSDDELAPLAKVNVDSLKEFDFFTYLTIGNSEVTFVPPSEYWLEMHDGRLTLFYTLPVGRPIAVKGRATLEVFDPEYFVAFAFVKDSPASIEGAPAGCTAVFHPPRELDSSAAAILGSIPADQRELPPDLAAMTDGLANLITVECS
jgi:ABC-type uncharacterized transport system substrate-binding protein